MSAKKRRRDDRAERAAAMRRERERQAQRRAQLITTGIVAAVVALIVIAVIAIRSNSSSSSEAGATPTAATDKNGLTYTAADSASGATPPPSSSSLRPVPVVLYEDFQCPTCKLFEGASGGYLEQQAAAGAITIEYRPIAILDRMSSTEYSTRSASAAACVYEDAGPAVYVKFHDELYNSQPPEGGDGLTDDQLTQLATTAGASDSVSSCISNQTYKGWVTRATDTASKDGVTGTPTVLVGGEVVTGATGAPTQPEMMQAISAARDGAASPSPS